MSPLLRWAALLSILFAACGPTAPPPRGIGEACAPSAPGEPSLECADGICVALDSASGFCTGPCQLDDDCPTDFVCQASGRYGRICRRLSGCKTDTECPSGHVCNTQTAHCYIAVSRMLCSPCQDVAQCPQGGTCFSALGSGEQFCTAPCTAGACPLGFVCKQIPAGEGGQLVSQCVPTSQTCNFGKSICSACTGDAECGGPFDLCVRNVVSGETFCGKDCNPAKNVCPTAGCDPAALDSAANPDCPSGFSCTNIGKTDDPSAPKGPYQCVPNSNTCQGWCDAADEAGQLRQCGLGQDCDLINKLCRPASDGRMCAPCLDNDDCRKGAHPENRCIVNDCPDCPFRGEAFCATQCADDAACTRSFGPGFVCEPVTDPTGVTTSFCIPQRGSCQVGLGRLGEDCSKNGAQDCVAGVCLVIGEISMCSLPCAQDTDCGDTRYRCCEYSSNGYDCSDEKRTAVGPLSGAGVCAPLGGLFGDDCSPGRPPCQTGTCLDLGTARVCTVTCATGCPDGFSCRKAELAGGDQLDVCFPNGGGLPGADCTFGPAACQSGLCIRKESGPICTASCQADSDCPTDWRCELVRAIDDSSVQACLPPVLQ